MSSFVASSALRVGRGVWQNGVIVSLALMLAMAIALLPLPGAMALVLGFPLLLVLLIRPSAGLWLLPLAVPYGSLRENGIGGLDLSLTEPLVALVFVAWLAAGIRERRVVIRHAPLYLPLLVFLTFAAFSLTTAPELALAAKELVKWAALFLAYFLVVNMVEERREAWALLLVIFIAAISEGALGFYQFVAKAGPKSFALGPFLRAFGTFGQPNPYAGYLAMAALLASGLALVGLRRLIRSRGKLQERWLVLLGCGAFLASVAGVVMSFSRGAWLGLAVGLMIVAVLHDRRALWGILVGLVILAVIVGLGVSHLLPAQIVDRLSGAVAYFGVFDARAVKLTPENWPLVERMAAWQAAWDMFEANPLLGVGLGNYVEAYKDYHLPDWKEPKGHAHNVYLNTLAETGIIGLIAYLILLVSFFVHLARVLSHAVARRGLEVERAVLIGAVGSLAVFVVHNLFDVLFVHGIGVQLGLVLGIVTVLSRLNAARDDRDAIGSERLEACKG